MTSPERTRPVTRARFSTIAAIAIVLVIALLWRPFAAWWCDDRGNIALARGDRASALVLFQRGLTFTPASSVLLEDRGRARLDDDPSSALADFTASDCGQPCI